MNIVGLNEEGAICLVSSDIIFQLHNMNTIVKFEDNQ